MIVQQKRQDCLQLPQSEQLRRLHQDADSDIYPDQIKCLSTRRSIYRVFTCKIWCRSQMLTLAKGGGVGATGLCGFSSRRINFQIMHKIVLVLYSQLPDSGSQKVNRKTLRCMNGSQNASVLLVSTATGHNHTKPAKRKAL